MRIGLNLLYLIPGAVGGTQTYAESLIGALARVAPDDELVVFLNREAAELPLGGADVQRVVVPVPGRVRAARYVCEQAVLPSLLRRHRVDLVHSLGYVGPAATHCPRVVTIPDVNYRAYPMSPLRRATLGCFVTRSARTAHHVVTISEFARREIVRELGVPPERLTVVHLAGPELAAFERRDVAPDVSRGELARAYGVPGPYVLAFSSPLPHKNIARLVRAFAAVAPRVPHTLVVAGHLPWSASDLATIRAAEATGRVRAIGYVPGAHVLPLLRYADLFVFPSLYEGFGLPALEAQAAGVPVACSNAGALPEVAGEGAVLFDPSAEDYISRALARCLLDAALREHLRRAGRANVARFSWEATARATDDVYRRVLGAPPVSPAPTDAGAARGFAAVDRG